MANKLRIGIIGAGKVATLHAKAIKSSKHFTLVGICGGNSRRTKTLANLFQVPAFTDIGVFIDKSKLDVVSVCTPHPLHAITSVPFLEKGVHVIVEKPMATSVKDCDIMIEASKKGGSILGVISQRRYFAPCMRIKKAVEDGRIGKPIIGTVNMYGWRDKRYYSSDAWRGTWSGEGGGVLVNQAIHQLDLLLWYMGPPVEVFGIWDNLNHPYIEVDDTAVAVIRFASGALGSVVVSNSLNPPLYGNVRVHGDNGSSLGVITDSGEMFVAGVSEMSSPPLNDLWLVPGQECPLSKWAEVDHQYFKQFPESEHYHRMQLDDFAHSIASGESPAVSGADGRRAVELISAIYEANQTKNLVKIEGS